MKEIELKAFTKILKDVSNENLWFLEVGGL
jgi:hypothetical protein